jgi:dTDP-4-dehydrorhamnose 3,5-epimerase
MHFQEFPPGQGKFVFVPHGRIIDIVVDLRKSSSTFLAVNTFSLDSVKRSGVFIPAGVAHGFISLKDETSVTYICDKTYDPTLERTINVFSVGLDLEQILLEHEIHDTVLSERDNDAIDLRDYLESRSD